MRLDGQRRRRIAAMVKSTVYLFVLACLFASWRCSLAGPFLTIRSPRAEFSILLFDGDLDCHVRFRPGDFRWDTAARLRISREQRPAFQKAIIGMTIHLICDNIASRWPKSGNDSPLITVMS